MPQATLRVRVERLESTVDSLRTLPERIARLEHTVAAGNAALRAEIKALDARVAGGEAAVRGEIKAVDTNLRQEIARVEKTVDRMRLDMGEMHAQVLGAIGAIDQKTDEARRHAIVLYEDLKTLIKTIREGD